MDSIYSDVADIAIRSIAISGSATILSTTWSLPASYHLAVRGAGRWVEAIMESLVGIPTVLLGLLLYFLFSASGPLGSLGLLYTPTAIIIGEAILITPLLIAVTYRSMRPVVRDKAELAISLGASRSQMLAIILRETWSGVIASTIMGFSRALGELGIAMMVGGNIAGYTRVMTTAIALGVSRGEFEEALALGLILLAIMVASSIAIKLVGGVKVSWSVD